MKCEYRSNCPISSALDIIGDKWTLIIIRDMMIKHKKTYKELVESNEKIATNILASRLKSLEEFNIITKNKPIDNKKTNIYLLTDKGLGLASILIELGIWSEKHIRQDNTLMHQERVSFFTRDSHEIVEEILSNYKKMLENIVLDTTCCITVN